MSILHRVTSTHSGVDIKLDLSPDDGKWIATGLLKWPNGETQPLVPTAFLPTKELAQTIGMDGAREIINKAWLKVPKDPRFKGKSEPPSEL